MNRPTYAELENELQALLDFPYRVAAVRLLKTEEEYQQLAIPEPKSALNYCQMVKAALTGHSFKASQAEHFRCLAGPSTIGILPYPAESESGENLCDIGMYRDLVVAHDIAQKMAHCPHWAYGVAVQPLSACSEPPQVVIIVTNPFNAMRIVQGYSFEYGTNTSFQMTGNQAFCSECTAYPLQHGRINISLLCSGTRNRVKWNENELAVGIPFIQLETVIRGIRSTVNPMELDDKKAQIQQKLQQLGEDTQWIRFGWNYWSGLKERQDQTYAGLLDKDKE